MMGITWSRSTDKMEPHADRSSIFKTYCFRFTIKIYMAVKLRMERHSPEE